MSDWSAARYSGKTRSKKDNEIQGGLTRKVLTLNGYLQCHKHLYQINGLIGPGQHQFAEYIAI